MRNIIAKQLNEYKRSFDFRLNFMQKNCDNNYYVQKFIYTYANIQTIFRNKALRQINVGNKQTSSRHMSDESRPVPVIRHNDVGGRSQCIGRIRPIGFGVRIGRVGRHHRQTDFRQYSVGNQHRGSVYKDLSGRIQLSLFNSVISDTTRNKGDVTHMDNLVTKIIYGKNANLFFNTILCKYLTFKFTPITIMHFEYNNSQKNNVNCIIHKHSNGPPLLCSRKSILEHCIMFNKSSAISRNYRIFCANVKIISYAKFFTFRKSTTIILEMNRVLSIVDMEKEVQEVDKQGLPVGDARRVTFSIVNFQQEEMETLPTDNNRRSSRSSHHRNENTNLEPEINDNPGDLTRINVRSKSNGNNAKTIAKGDDKKLISKETCSISKRDNHKEQIPRGSYRRRKKTSCTCTTATKFETKPAVFLSIHNRKKRKPKTKICPLGNKNRTRTINYIKNRFQRGEGIMINELQASKHKSMEMSIARMWHYIDNTAYIFKQKGSKEDLISLVYELENLSFAIDIGVEQLDRWLEADHRDRHMEDDLDVLLVAERTEAILQAEWTIRKNYIKQVRKILNFKLVKTSFRKMANLEVKLNNIGAYTGEIQDFVTSLLRENKNINSAKIKKLQKTLQEMGQKVRLERNKALAIVEVIEKNSQEPRSIDELYTEISERLGEVSNLDDSCKIYIRKILNLNPNSNFYYNKIRKNQPIILRYLTVNVRIKSRTTLWKTWILTVLRIPCHHLGRRTTIQSRLIAKCSTIYSHVHEFSPCYLDMYHFTHWLNNKLWKTYAKKRVIVDFILKEKFLYFSTQNICQHKPAKKNKKMNTNFKKNKTKIENYYNVIITILTKYSSQPQYILCQNIFFKPSLLRKLSYADLYIRKTTSDTFFKVLCANVQFFQIIRNLSNEQQLSVLIAAEIFKDHYQHKVNSLTKFYLTKICKKINFFLKKNNVTITDNLFSFKAKTQIFNCKVFIIAINIPYLFIGKYYRFCNMDENEVTLSGRRIKGVIAMMLAEVNEYEDSSQNRATWRKVKRGLEDNLTTVQASHLIAHAYFSLGVARHREKGWELMKEAESLPFDQINHYIVQASEQDNPALKNAKHRGKDGSTQSRSYSREGRNHSRTGGSFNREHSNKQDRYYHGATRARSRSRRSERSKGSNNNDNQNLSFTRNAEYGELKYSSVPCNILVDHLRCSKGYYSVPPSKYWPNSVQTRVDTPLVNIQHGRDICYWKDIYITPTNPTALFGSTPLHKLTPFYLICGLYRVAKTKPEYRKQLTYMLRFQEARDAVNEILLNNKSWTVRKFHSRCKQNAVQLIRNDRGDWNVTQILLYKEPLFVPKKEPDNKPCFADGTEPPRNSDNPITIFTHLDVYVGEHIIHTYSYEDMLILGDE